MMNIGRSFGFDQGRIFSCSSGPKGCLWALRNPTGHIVATIDVVEHKNGSAQVSVTSADGNNAPEFTEAKLHWENGRVVGISLFNGPHETILGPNKRISKAHVRAANDHHALPVVGGLNLNMVIGVIGGTGVGKTVYLKSLAFNAKKSFEPLFRGSKVKFLEASYDQDRCEQPPDGNRPDDLDRVVLSFEFRRQRFDVTLITLPGEVLIRGVNQAADVDTIKALYAQALDGVIVMENVHTAFGLGDLRGNTDVFINALRDIPKVHVLTGGDLLTGEYAALLNGSPITSCSSVLFPIDRNADPHLQYEQHMAEAKLLYQHLKGNITESPAFVVSSFDKDARADGRFDYNTAKNVVLPVLPFLYHYFDL